MHKYMKHEMWCSDAFETLENFKATYAYYFSLNETLEWNYDRPAIIYDGILNIIKWNQAKFRVERFEHEFLRIFFNVHV